MTKDPYKSVVPASVFVTWYKSVKLGEKNGDTVYDEIKVTDALILDCTIGMINTFTFTIVEPTFSELDNYLTYTSRVS